MVQNIGDTMTVNSKLTIDINTATLAELCQLPGIGPAKAQTIINTRRFTKVKHLVKVPGISEKMLEKIKEEWNLIVIPLKGTKFFKNLCVEVQMGRGVSIKLDDGWHFLISKGELTGDWYLSQNVTKWRPVLSLTRLHWPYGTHECSIVPANPASPKEIREKAKEMASTFFQIKNWKKAFFITSRDVHARRTLFEVFEIYRACLSGVTDPQESLVRSLLGHEGLELWRNLNQHRKKALKNLIKSRLFEELGCRRRSRVLARFLNAKRGRDAFKASWAFNPAIVNQLVRDMHKDNCYASNNCFGILQGDARHHKSITLTSMLRMLGPNHKLSHAIQLYTHSTWSYIPSRYLPNIIEWYSKYPAPRCAGMMSATLIEFTKLLKESHASRRSITSNNLLQEHLKENKLSSDHLLEMIDGIENWNFEQVKALHNRRIPEAIEHLKEVKEKHYKEKNKALDMEKKRLSLKYKKAKKKYAPFLEAWKIIQNWFKENSEDGKKLLPKLEVPDMRLLTSKVDYLAESQKMKHCISLYYGKSEYLQEDKQLFGLLLEKWDPTYSLMHKDYRLCKEILELIPEIIAGKKLPQREHFHAWHVEYENEMGTLGIWVREDGSMRMCEFSGFMNAIPSDKLVQFAKQCFVRKGWDPTLIEAGRHPLEDMQF